MNPLDYLDRSIATYDADPPSNDYQRGCLDALKVARSELASMLDTGARSSAKLVERMRDAIHIARFKKPGQEFEPWKMDDSDREYCTRLALAALAASATDWQVSDRAPTDTLLGWREALHNLAIAAGELITATDAREELRPQRQAALDALGVAKGVLTNAPSGTESIGTVLADCAEFLADIDGSLANRCEAALSQIGVGQSVDTVTDAMLDRVMSLIEERLCMVWYPRENRETFRAELEEAMRSGEKSG